MAKRKTIGENPLDAVIPGPGSEASAKRGRRALVKAALEPERPARVEKERLTIHLTVELIDRVKNCVFWTPGLTLAGLGEQAFEQIVKKMEKEHGGPFPARKQELKGGRPMK